MTYENPEQPPPRTPRRIAASGVPRCARRFFAYSTAPSEIATDFWPDGGALGSLDGGALGSRVSTCSISLFASTLLESGVFLR
jgi:hypothetical protein